MSDFFDATIEERIIVLILEPTLRKVEKLILGCETCSPEDADLPFHNVLDRVTGRRHSGGHAKSEDSFPV